mmetsp:Transcript_28440/g.60308  ORF Transcript_28440/g.60308 Transcript_28440/m.60308 type:complete len:481 (-) Transcript_28440:71-1513(-)
MELLTGLLASCGSVQKANVRGEEDEDASEIQLNAFEFRNYRTTLEPGQQKLLERVVNQWCSMLVKGKTLKVNDFEEKVYLDKDLLTMEYNNEFYPLKAICKMEMFKDPDDMMHEVPWGLDITFEGAMGDSSLRFNFEQERQRLNFAITLRILRTRDPTLDPSQTVEVSAKDDEEDEDADKPSFGKVVGTQHYDIEAGIPIVFSVSDLKLYHKLASSSRHCYLEFFVRYPRQDKFLYAKSPTTHIPQNVMQAEDTNWRKKKEKKDEAELEQERKNEETKRSVLGQDIPISAMRFDLKNVKLKIPKVPHTLFGRLMAKDDYFPTAIGTFELEVKRAFLQDRREKDELTSRKSKSGKDDGSRKDPETVQIPMMSTTKMATQDSKEEKFVKLGLLTVRIIGYVTDLQHHDKAIKDADEDKSKKKKGDDDDDEDEDESDEDNRKKDDKKNAPAKKGDAGKKKKKEDSSSEEESSSESESEEEDDD